jgi:hypothetical protein
MLIDGRTGDYDGTSGHGDCLSKVRHPSRRRANGLGKYRLMDTSIPSAPISAAELNTFFEFQIKHTGEATARRDVKRWHLPAP